MQPFTFDHAEAQRSIRDPDGALWPVNAYTDVDELDSLVQAALDSGAISRAESRSRLYVYPLSLAEPEPLLAVDAGAGPTLLGHSLKLIDREGESPVAFTLRLLEELTAEANGLIASAAANAEQAMPCTCSDVRGCPQCFDRAEGLIGALVRDERGREWEVVETDEKDGFPTVCGERFWARVDDVEVLHERG